MKIYKINSLTTILFTFLVIGLVVLLPITLIQNLWNSTIGRTYTDISINFWQALILWMIVLVVLNIMGLFKFEFAVEANDALEKDIIKKNLESLQNTFEKKEEVEKENKNTK